MSEVIRQLREELERVTAERDDLEEALSVLGLLQRETQRERDEARNVARSYRRRWLTASGTTPQEDLPENLRWLNANILGVIGTRWVTKMGHKEIRELLWGCAAILAVALLVPQASNLLPHSSINHQPCRSGKIADLRVGEATWAVPWAAQPDRQRRFWLNDQYTGDCRPGGTGTMKVIREQDGYVCDVRECEWYKWEVTDAPSWVGQDKPVPVVRVVD